MATYRLRVALTYTTTANATTATTAIDNALIAAGRAERATRTNLNVDMLITGGMTEAQATSLANSLVAAAATGAKSGKISTVRTP